MSLMCQEALEGIQKDINFKEEERRRQNRDLLSKVEIQAKICAELLRENEAFKAESTNNKSQLAQTQAQLKQYLTWNPPATTTEINQMEGSFDVNLCESGNETHHNENAQLVLLGSQNPHTQSKRCDSPLSKALFLNTFNNQSTQNNEIDELKVKVQEYQLNYVRKDYLIKFIEKLQETFENVEVDASSLRALLVSNQDVSTKGSTTDFNAGKITEEMTT